MRGKFNAKAQRRQGAKGLLYCGAMLLGLSLFACNIFGGSSKPEFDLMDSELAFCGKLGGKDGFDVFLLDLNKDSWTNLTQQFDGQIDGFGNDVGCEERFYPYDVQGIAWSPDGAAIAVGIGGPYFNLVYILEVDSQGQASNAVLQWPRPKPRLHIFDNPFEMAWSPAGDNFAFIAEETATDAGYVNLFVGDVTEWRLSTSETEMLQLTDEDREWPGVIFAPSWSPDGKIIAVSLNGPTSGVALLSADGEESIFITDETSDQLSRVKEPFPWPDFPATQPSWFPDGNGLVFVAAANPESRSTLFRVDRDGQNLTLLIPYGVRNPVVSPDGQHIAYIQYSEDRKRGEIGKIILVDQDGQNPQILATIKASGIGRIFGEYHILDLVWSPSGEWLAFASDHTGEFRLYLVAADGSRFIQVSAFPGVAMYPQWRPG